VTFILANSNAAIPHDLSSTPPGNAPVIVTKDVGGYVNEYGAQTKLYFDTGREVRLHECRSACTLALSLPNVCVYPDSLLKFHKAYNPITKQANEDVSIQMMDSYPEAIRQRLGELTRTYKVLTGSELIRLGIRDCNKPLGPNYAVARAKPTPNATSGVFGSIAQVFSPSGEKVFSPSGEKVFSPSDAQPTAVQVKAQRVRVATESPPIPRPEAPAPETAPAPDAAEAMPQPPMRPADLDSALPSLGSAKPSHDQALPSHGAAALAIPPPPTVTPPPPAPKAPPPDAIVTPEVRISSQWGRPIVGSVPILKVTHFQPYAYRSLKKG